MVTQFISNKTIEQEIIEAISKAKTEICLSSPWIKSSTLKNLFTDGILEKIRSKEISLKVVFRVRQREDMKITDTGVIQFLKDAGVEIRHSHRLHAKMAIIDDKVAFASSSNITAGGYREEGNEEAGFWTDDAAQVKEAKQRFLEIWEAAQIFDPDTVGLILTPTYIREFQFVVLDKINEGSFVTVNYEGPDGVIGIAFARVAKIERFNPEFFQYGEEQNHLFKEFVKIHGQREKEFKHLASLGYLDPEKEIAIGVCEVLGTINKEDLDSGVRLDRRRWRMALFPLSVGSEVIRAKKEFLDRLFTKDMVQLGTIKGHQSQVGMDPEKILQMHCMVLGMTGSGKSNCVKVFIPKFMDWAKRNQARIVILDPHGEYSRLPFVEKEYCDEICKRFINSVESFEDISGIKLGPRNSKEGKERHNVIAQGIKQSETIVEFVKYIEEHNQTKVTQIIKECIPQVSGKLLKKMAQAEASEEYTEILYGTKKPKEGAEVIVSLSKEEDNSLRKFLLDKYMCKIQKEYTKMEEIEKVETKELFTKEEIDQIGVLVDKAVLQKKDLDFSKNIVYDINLKGIDEPEEKYEVAGDIIEQLFLSAKKEENFKALIVVEEAQNFAPEGGRRAYKSLRKIIQVAKEGRKFDLGLLIVTQRPAGVSKEVLAQCNTQVLFRLVNQNDIEQLATSIEAASKGMLEQIPSLTTGTGYVTGVSVPMPILVDVEKFKE
jgi:hypothetical protein